ncbi:MAG: ornithine carbamoyltransferase [Candidatus Aminicenantaceae bacterium]
MLKDFLSINGLSIYQFNEMLDIFQKVKKNPKKYKNKLQDKILAMIFQKPSLRTRMTFEVGMLQLGGEAVYLSPTDIQMGKRETPYDVGKNLERWIDGIMIRTFDHKDVIDLAETCRVPVINALTDYLHPCQGMADFATIKEKKTALSQLKLAYVGDGNNVCHSLIFAASKAGAQMEIATPKGYEPDNEVIKKAEIDGKETGSRVNVTNNPEEAVKNADVVYTDTWASMGQEHEREERIKIFTPFQVNEKLMSKAKNDALFMHCLPAHRGEEVTDEVIDSSQSEVYNQAENRLHIQKVILLLLLEKQDRNG